MDKQELDKQEEEVQNDEDVEEVIEDVIEPKNLSKDQLLAVERKRIEKKHLEKMSELEAKVEAYETEQEEGRRAELSELDQAKEDIERLNSELSSVSNEKTLLEVTHAQEQWVNENAPQELPGVYKSLVKGTSVEELQESLEAVVSKFNDDFGNANNGKSIGVKPPSKEGQADITDTKDFDDMSNEDLKAYLGSLGVRTHSF